MLEIYKDARQMTRDKTGTQEQLRFAAWLVFVVRAGIALVVVSAIALAAGVWYAWVLGYLLWFAVFGWFRTKKLARVAEKSTQPRTSW